MRDFATIGGGMPPPGRYNIETVTKEVRRVLSERRPPRQVEQVSQKQLSLLLDVSEGQISRKIRLSDGRSRFSIEELGVIADLFDAPPGWPFLPWAEPKRKRGS